MLELLAPCSGVSILLTPKIGVLVITLDRFLTIGWSLPLAEFADCTHPPAEEYLVGITLEGSPSSF
jgi:hypothetical protein